MARSVDLRSARAPSTPPAGAPLPVLKGTPPKPAGAFVYAPSRDVPDDVLLTPQEREAAAARGLTAAQALQPDVAEGIRRARDDSANPPAPGRVRLGAVPPEDQEALARRVTPPQPLPGRFQLVDDLEDADLDDVQDMAPSVKAAAQVAARAAQAAAEAPPEPAPPAAADETGAGVRPEACDHCGWPSGQRDDVTPAPEDEEDYVIALCGDRPFVKEYPVMGGRAFAAFRTLALAEADAVYKQVAAEARADDTLTMGDYRERVARLRFCLQLVHVRLPGELRELPEGLSPRTNPNAASFWETDPGSPPLPQIEEYVQTHVASQETLFQALTTRCRQFNRLVSKIHDRATAADFSPPTG